PGRRSGRIRRPRGGVAARSGACRRDGGARARRSGSPLGHGRHHAAPGGELPRSGEGEASVSAKVVERGNMCSTQRRRERRGKRRENLTESGFTCFPGSSDLCLCVCVLCAYLCVL